MVLLRRRVWLPGAAALLLSLLAVNELFMLFPLTPLWLEREDRTRLPPAGGDIRVALAGDILLGDAAAATLSRRGLDWPFAATRRLLLDADLAVGNLEGPISPNGTPEDARWSYNQPVGAAAALRRAGFDLMSLGNNHVLDCGDIGVRETLAVLGAAGLTAFGAGPTQEAAARPAVRTVRGVRLAFVGYLAPAQLLDGKHFPLDHLAAGPRWGVALAGPRRYAEDLALARRQADLVIAIMHLGDRYQPAPTDEEQRLARQAVDAGAHAVVGHGPHILGPLEIYRGRPILYSIGNYAFGSGNLRARHSLLGFFDIEPGPRPRLRRVQLLPIYTVNRSPWVRYQAKVLVGWKARRVLEALRRRSPAGSRFRLEEGPTRLSAELWQEDLFQGRPQ